MDSKVFLPPENPRVKSAKGAPCIHQEKEDPCGARGGRLEHRQPRRDCSTREGRAQLTILSRTKSPYVIQMQEWCDRSDPVDEDFHQQWEHMQGVIFSRPSACQWGNAVLDMAC